MGRQRGSLGEDPGAVTHRTGWSAPLPLWDSESGLLTSLWGPTRPPLAHISTCIQRGTWSGGGGGALSGGGAPSNPDSLCIQTVCVAQLDVTQCWWYLCPSTSQLEPNIILRCHTAPPGAICGWHPRARGSTGTCLHCHAV